MVARFAWKACACACSQSYWNAYDKIGHFGRQGELVLTAFTHSVPASRSLRTIRPMSLKTEVFLSSHVSGPQPPRFLPQHPTTPYSRDIHPNTCRYRHMVRHARLTDVLRRSTCRSPPADTVVAALRLTVVQAAGTAFYYSCLV